MTVARATAAAFLLLALGACSQLRESQPGRTATEQLLFSRAVERVCDKLAIELPAGSKVYVDASYVEGTDSKYLVATLRDRILRHGGRLVAARDQADLVFEPRVGALSIDRKKRWSAFRASQFRSRWPATSTFPNWPSTAATAAKAW